MSASVPGLYSELFFLSVRNNQASGNLCSSSFHDIYHITRKYVLHRRLGYIQRVNRSEARISYGLSVLLYLHLAWEVIKPCRIGFLFSVASIFLKSKSFKGSILVSRSLKMPSSASPDRIENLNPFSRNTLDLQS